jgi:ribosomal 50S subunit-recycling heat shock protein
VADVSYPLSPELEWVGEGGVRVQDGVVVPADTLRVGVILVVVAYDEEGGKLAIRIEEVHTQTHAHTYTHTYTQKQTQKHTHTHTHTHTGAVCRGSHRRLSGSVLTA